MHAPMLRSPPSSMLHPRVCVCVCVGGVSGEAVCGSTEVPAGQRRFVAPRAQWSVVARGLKTAAAHVQMFFGMSLCLPLAYWQQWQKQQKKAGGAAAEPLLSATSDEVGFRPRRPHSVGLSRLQVTSSAAGRAVILVGTGNGGPLEPKPLKAHLLSVCWTAFNLLASDVNGSCHVMFVKTSTIFIASGPLHAFLHLKISGDPWFCSWVLPRRRQSCVRCACWPYPRCLI